MPWLSAFEAQKYLDGMQWKRSIHAQYHTALMETYSYENAEGVLLTRLEAILTQHGVTFHPLDAVQVFRTVYEHRRRDDFSGLTVLLQTFIGLFKSNGWDARQWDELRHQNATQELTPFLRERTRLFLDMAEPIYRRYQAHLQAESAIDFHDMINQATALVETGTVPVTYQYVMIDEYQDISRSRFRLVQAIADRCHAKVLAVGDDWQSIYRFAGSDLSLLTHFEEAFGPYELLKIEQTYRNPQELIQVAGQFVMRNPQQYQKHLRSVHSFVNPLQVVGYRANMAEALNRVVEHIVQEDGPRAHVMLLGRNHADLQPLERLAGRYQVRRGQQGITIIDAQHPGLHVAFQTVHSSKGLEADHVILLMSADPRRGFPSVMADDPVLTAVLPALEVFPNAEERRLFYVALTPTRQDVWVLTPDPSLSPFVDELVRDFSVPYRSADGKAGNPDPGPSCPRCQSGHLVLRKRGTQALLGCSNFPQCRQTFRDVRILQNPRRCPQCQGYLVQRTGRQGSFWGCTNFPACRYTAPLGERASR